MKITLVVPDEILERVSKGARDLGMSRSEFISPAASRFLDELDSESVTHQIDMAVIASGHSDPSTAAVDAGHRLLIGATDAW